jgi:WD40 repeat protein
MRLHAFPPLALLWLVLSAGALAADKPPAVAPSQSPEFNANILPLLTKYCAGCHNSTDREGKLVLESYADLVRGGKRGAEIVAGHSEQSRLVRVLNGQTEPSMPPKDNDRPKPAEIALLAAWIDAGAKGPSGAALDPTVLLVPKVTPVGPVRRPINAVACSPDGRWIAVARYGAVELLSAETRKLVRTLADLPGNVNDVVFCADSSMLAAAAGQAALFGEATLWNVSDGTLIRKFRGHRDSLYAIAVSPDMRILATAGYDQQIKLWDLRAGTELRTLKGHNGAVFALAFDPRGKLLASASGDRTVKLWDVASGERLETFGQPLQDQYTVAFSPDGQHLAAAGADNRVRIWKISASGKEGTNPIERTEFADEQPVVKLAYSPDGQMLVTSGDDRMIKFWNASTLAELRTLERQTDVAPALAFQPANRHRLVVGRMDGSLAVYDTALGQRVAGAAEIAVRSIVAVAAGAGTRVVRAALVASAALAEVPLAGFLSAAPEQPETEPNNTPAQANALKKLPTTVVGALNVVGDVDYFSFESAAGQTFVFDAAARSIGSKAAPRLSLFDGEGKLLRDQSEFDAESDPLLVYHFDRAGRYLIRIDDRTMSGGPDHKYKLTIGAIPYVVGCYPLSVPASKATDVELIGYNLPPGTTAKVMAGSAGEATVPIDTGKLRVRGPIKVLVGDLPETVPVASSAGTNDTLQQATPMAAPGSAAGRIRSRSPGQPAEANYYRFQSKAGQNWIVETEAARRGSPIDTRIDVLTADGHPIERLVLKAVRDSYINFRGLDSLGNSPRLKSYEEMELNQYIFIGGEVCKLYQAPRGPDSDFGLYMALNGSRRTYFDTTATSHANFEPVYVVEPHPPGTKLPNNGLPSFPIYYSNDDDGDRKLGRDSRLWFMAPADGWYVIRVVDSRGQAGERYVFRLTVRKPQPDFRVNLVGANTTVNAGSGQQFRIQADRLDYFDGDIRVDITNVPPGFTVTSPLVIQAGHLEAHGVLFALDGSPQPTPQNAGISQISATARIDGREVMHRIGSLGQIKLGGKPNVIVHLQPARPAAVAMPTKPRSQHWVAVDPISFISKGGATLTKQADNSLLAGGANPDKDSYVVVARTDLRNIRAVRLEVLGDKGLPAGAPGRSEGNGNFVLSQFRMSAAPQIDFTGAAPVTFQSAEADYSEPDFPVAAAIDGKGATGWAIGLKSTKRKLSVMRKGNNPSHTATFQMKMPLDFPGGAILTFTLDQTSSVHRHNLGRFRLSLLADEPPTLEPPPPIPEVVIAPGTTTTCKLTIDRRGFAGSVEFEVNDLPHGVIVDNIGLNGILIPAGQNEQTVFLTAAPWVAPIDRLFFAVTKSEGGQASLPVWLRVRRAGISAKLEEGSARR